MLRFLWTIVIGFIAGVIAKRITRGSEHEPKGFVLTTLNGSAPCRYAELPRDQEFKTPRQGRFFGF